MALRNFIIADGRSAYISSQPGPNQNMLGSVEGLRPSIEVVWGAATGEFIAWYETDPKCTLADKPERPELYTLIPRHLAVLDEVTGLWRRGESEKKTEEKEPGYKLVTGEEIYVTEIADMHVYGRLVDSNTTDILQWNKTTGILEDWFTIRGGTTQLKRVNMPRNIEEYAMAVPKTSTEEPLQAGRKNSGKLQWNLVDFSALEGMVKVLEAGAIKYSPDNWKQGLPVTEVWESLMRHMTAFQAGEDNDPETGLPHTGHMLCNAMFLAWTMQNKPEFDNRKK